MKVSHGHAAVMEELYFTDVTGKLGRQNTAWIPESEDLPAASNYTTVTNDGPV